MDLLPERVANVTRAARWHRPCCGSSERMRRLGLARKRAVAPAQPHGGVVRPCGNVHAGPASSESK